MATDSDTCRSANRSPATTRRSVPLLILAGGFRVACGGPGTGGPIPGGAAVVSPSPKAALMILSRTRVRGTGVP
jgi:hypothetical protein